MSREAAANVLRVASKKSTSGGGYRLLLKDSAIYGVGNIVQKFLSALLLPLYTVFLSPADYGVLGMVLTTSSLIYVVINIGFDVAYTRFFFDDDSPEHRNNVITATFWAWTVYPAIVLVLLALVMPQLSRALMGQPGYTFYFDLGLIYLFFSNWYSLPLMLFRLEHRPLTYLSFMIAQIFVQVPLTVVLVTVVHLHVLGVLIGNAVALFVLNTAGIPFYWRRLTWRVDTRLLKQMIGMALPATATGLVFFILKFSDRYFVMRYWGQTQVGLYTTANTLSQPIYLALVAFNLAWPQWHYAHLKDEARHKRLVADSATYFLLLCVLLLAGLGVFMPGWIRLLTARPAYWSVGPATLVLGLAMVLNSAYNVFWVGANVAKKNRLVPAVVGAGSLVNLGLNIVLIPRWGIIAASWTTVAGFAVLAVLMLLVSRRYYVIPYQWSRFAKMALAGAVTLAAGFVVQRLSGESVYQPFWHVMTSELLKVPTLALFPLTLIVTRFFTPGEKAAIRRFARRTLSRLRRHPAPSAAVPAAGEPLAATGSLSSASAHSPANPLSVVNPLSVANPLPQPAEPSPAAVPSAAPLADLSLEDAHRLEDDEFAAERAVRDLNAQDPQ